MRYERVLLRSARYIAHGTELIVNEKAGPMDGNQQTVRTSRGKAPQNTPSILTRHYQPATLLRCNRCNRCTKFVHFSIDGGRELFVRGEMLAGENCCPESTLNVYFDECHVLKGSFGVFEFLLVRKFVTKWTDFVLFYELGFPRG